ncbi:MAG: nicotinate phosphoribosyltransferase [Myxococcales bacterium]|nr:nicotinate phosphoribosyltransferase [Myxococcales bacterium]
MIPATHIDLYQLTSLIPHWDAGLANTRVVMSFFSRRLPQDDQGHPVRGFLLFVGLRRALTWLEAAIFDEERILALQTHPMLGPALDARPDLIDRLRNWRFSGRVLAPREGTPIVAGLAVRSDGAPLAFDELKPAAQTPYFLIECDMVTAKLIETPLLSIINHMTMVGSKAAHIALAAGGRPVFEFGSRRTHPLAAVDAAYAGYVAGCAGTSNVEAHCSYGIPVVGTMDHFAIQAWERADVPRHESEHAYFAEFYRSFPDRAILLVDTYETFGELTGIRNAVRATDGKLKGIRIDSTISRDSVRAARRLLDELGARQAQIIVSGGMDEHAIRALGDAPVDAFGIGERLVTAPDAPVGVGAVAKLCEIGGKPTMKLARGSGKASLPGRVQVFRRGLNDLVAREGETPAGDPLLQLVWDDTRPLDLPSVDETRRYALSQLELWKERARQPTQPTIPITPALEGVIADLLAHG